MSKTQRIIDAFTDMAPSYEQTLDRELQQLWGINYEEFIERLLSRASFEGVTNLLDVATGRAAIPRALLKRSDWRGRVVGVDITPEMLRGARAVLASDEPGASVSLVSGSGMQLPFAAGSFDAAVCALATHHMDVALLLAELRRVLQPGALVLLADVATAPFWRSPTGRIWLQIVVRWYTFRHGSSRLHAEVDALDNMIDAQEWQTHLIRAGFVNAHLTVLPACKRWYPSGLLVMARAA